MRNALWSLIEELDHHPSTSRRGKVEIIPSPGSSSDPGVLGANKMCWHPFGPERHLSRLVGCSLVVATMPSKSRIKWLIIGCLIAVGLAAVWFLRRPKLVVVAHPRRVSMTETIASSARVGGVQETAVGAQFTGTIEQLFVKVGDRVQQGQPIATLRNEVTQQQKAQAQSAVETARAKLAQTSKPPLRSELDEASHGITEAKAQVAQINAQLQLATKDYERGKQMFEQGLIPRNEFERLQSNQQSLRSQLRSARATMRVREAKTGNTAEEPAA